MCACVCGCVHLFVIAREDDIEGMEHFSIHTHTLSLTLFLAHTLSLSRSIAHSLSHSRSSHPTNPLSILQTLEQQVFFFIERDEGCFVLLGLKSDDNEERKMEMEQL